MPWWGWILVGAILLGSELFVTTEFYLIFLGLAALAVGLFGLLLFEPAVWQQWLGFAALSVVLLVGVRRRVSTLFGPDAARVRDGVIGETGTAREAIAPGATGQAELRGSVWTVRNVGADALAPGDRLRALEIDGLTLEVTREP
jgi:membrane protein implicated in regulation of membrane protease activity